MRLGSASSLAPLSTEAQAYIDRLFMPPLPGSARENTIASFVDTIVAGGVFAKLDFLHLYASEDSGNSFTNVVSDNYQGKQVYSAGTLNSFVADQGWTCTGINAYVSSCFDPNTASSPNFSLTNASVGWWSATNSQWPNYDLGRENGANPFDATGGMTAYFLAYLRWVDPSSIGGANLNTSPGNTLNVGGVTDSSGMWLMNRTASNAQALYRDDVVTPIASGTQASAALPASALACASTRQMRAFWAGASLTEAERVTLKTAFTAYMTAITGGTP